MLLKDYREWMDGNKSRPRQTRLEATVEGQTRDDGLGHDTGCGSGEEVDRSEKYLGS